MSDRIKIAEEDGTHKAWMEEAGKVEDLDQLVAFVRRMREGYEHDYGTVVHAASAAMVAAFNVVNRGPQGGMTGFQASFIGLEMVRKFMGVTGPVRLIDYGDLLYPQYAHEFAPTISPSTLEWARAEAQKRIDGPNVGSVHASVMAHWRSIAAGEIPFGLTVKKED